MRIPPRSPSPARFSSRALLFVAAVAAALAVVACSAPAASAAPPAVSGAWVRSTAVAGQTSGAYFTITNRGAADALLSVASSAAPMVEMHQTTNTNGMTGMAPVDRVAIPAGGTVEFKPGGLHVMLMGVAAPLNAGTTVQLDLTFEHAGKVTVKADVRDAQP